MSISTYLPTYLLACHNMSLHCCITSLSKQQTTISLPTSHTLIHPCFLSHLTHPFPVCSLSLVYLLSSYVPKLVNLLRTPAYRARTLKLLYHLSADDRCKSMITYTDGVPLLMGMVINFPQVMQSAHPIIPMHSNI